MKGKIFFVFIAASSFLLFDFGSVHARDAKTENRRGEERSVAITEIEEHTERRRRKGGDT